MGDTMFSNYKINGKLLYLYVDDKCEIGTFFNKNKESNIIPKVRKYIKEHKINFNGTKVVLLLGGLMIGTVYLNYNLKGNDYNLYDGNKYSYSTIQEDYADERIEKEINKIVNMASTNNNSKSNIAITLDRTNGEKLQINLEDYLVGVVASEMPVSFNVEALKAQAVVARTYTMKLKEAKKTITDNPLVQVYKSNDELKKEWGNTYDTNYNKVKSAVDNTKGMCLKYDGALIEAIYHSVSNGYTEDASFVWKNNFPYLKTVTSPWDTSSPMYLKSVTIPFSKVSSALGIDFNNSSKIDVLSRNESNRITKIKFDDKVFTGTQVRDLLGLRSADFDTVVKQNGVLFTTRGYGHGVGMSQYGANEMAKAGYGYKDILKHYYQDVQIAKTY